MCGIAGIAFRWGERAAMASAMAEMEDRGPDGGGMWADHHVLLGHRRLRILDLDPRADQPLGNEDASVTVVYNGEIYEYRKLRAELERAGHRFRTSTDTEVLVHGYEAWGADGLVERISGMFAFGLWDARTRRLVLARDHFGKKPLFFSYIGGGISFASTLGALRRLLPRTPGLNLRAIDDYLTWMAVLPPATVFEGVHTLPPGHLLTMRGDGLPVVRAYASLDVVPDAAPAPSEGEALEGIDALVTTAVKRRLEADVPLGAFLSGGIDSGLVVAKMAAASSRPVTTVTVGFEGERDERARARRTAEMYGTDHHEEVVGPSSVTELPDLLRRFGQPFADPSVLPTFAVASAARRHVTVALNGDGGDELFAGYARPVLAKAAEQYSRLVPAGVRRRLLAHEAPMWLRGGRGPVRTLARLLEAGRGDVRGSLAYRRAARDLRTELYRPDFLHRLAGHHPDEHTALFGALPGDWPTRVLAADLWTYLSPQLLTKMDVTTMAAGLEGRSPLLDWELARYAMALTTRLKIPGYRPKHLLRRLAARYLPPGFAGLPKTGFAPPVSAWLRGPLGQRVQERWRHPGLAVWGLLQRDAVLGLWQRHQRGQEWAEALWTVLCLDFWIEDLAGGEVLVKEAVS